MDFDDLLNRAGARLTVEQPADVLGAGMTADEFGALVDLDISEFRNEQLP